MEKSKALIWQINNIYSVFHSMLKIRRSRDNDQGNGYVHKGLKNTV